MAIDGHLQAIDLAIAATAAGVLALCECLRGQEHHHRHPPGQSAKFALAVTLSGRDGICGVAIVGRPVARHLDDGRTLEVIPALHRWRTERGSKLYGAAWKA
ncbi:XF1762 family protein, partial [Thauera sp.]|uniref:XF1762 family protein n=1 Tax=Thauera sp. TaxID=1905334 RepID=UPI0039E439BD